MDEEDGRLGPPPGHITGNLPIDVTGGRTQQTGRDDVLTDAPKMSLRHLQKSPQNWVPQVSFLRPGKEVCTTKDQTKERPINTR